MEVEPEPQQQQTTSSRQLSPEELVLLKAEEAAIPGRACGAGRRCCGECARFPDCAD